MNAGHYFMPVCPFDIVAVFTSHNILKQDGPDRVGHLSFSSTTTENITFRKLLDSGGMKVS